MFLPQPLLFSLVFHLWQNPSYPLVAIASIGEKFSYRLAAFQVQLPDSALYRFDRHVEIGVNESDPTSSSF